MRPRTLSALAIALSGLAVAGCGGGNAKPKEIVPRLKVFTVGKQATGQSRRISGRVQAATTSPLSFGVAGKVLERPVLRGQRVVEGEVLARLDPEPLRLRVAKARAALGSTRAALDEARTALERTKALLPTQGASQQEVDQATTRFAAADADVETAKGALREAEIDFGRTEITAPFGGQVVETPVDPFQEVQPSETVIVLQADGVLEVSVLVPETMIASVDYGQVVQATLPSLEGVTVAGTVTLIGAVAEAGNAYPVTVRLAQTDADIRPGMTASVTFNFADYLDGKIAFLVPISSVAIDARLGSPPEEGPKGDKGQTPMFVLDPQSNTVELRQVRVGDLRGNELEVFEGLRAGDLVVTAGVAFVRDGMKAMPWSADGGLR